MPEDRIIPLELLNEPPEPIRVERPSTGIEELAASISRVGLINALSVYPQDGRYEIAAGHRRYLACRMAGLKEVRCVVYSDEETARTAVMLHENAFREEVTAAEEGWKYLELIEKQHHSIDDLCAAVGQSRAYIDARIEMVQRDARVALAVAERKISFSVARELNKIAREDWRHYFLEEAIQKGASVAQARTWAANCKREETLPAGEPAPAAPNPPGAPQPPNPFVCFVCGGEQHTHMMRTVYIHEFEIEWLRRALADAGMGAKT